MMCLFGVGISPGAACEVSLLLFIGKPAQGLQCAVRISDIQDTTGGGRGAFVERTFFRCGKGVNALPPSSTSHSEDSSTLIFGYVIYKAK